jgi:hypothetical protein
VSASYANVSAATLERLDTAAGVRLTRFDGT